MSSCSAPTYLCWSVKKARRCPLWFRVRYLSSKLKTNWQVTRHEKSVEKNQDGPWNFYTQNSLPGLFGDFFGHLDKDVFLYSRNTGDKLRETCRYLLNTLEFGWIMENKYFLQWKGYRTTIPYHNQYYICRGFIFHIPSLFLQYRQPAPAGCTGITLWYW